MAAHLLLGLTTSFGGERAFILPSWAPVKQKKRKQVAHKQTKEDKRVEEQQGILIRVSPGNQNVVADGDCQAIGRGKRGKVRERGGRREVP
jgi:hypothetical protein